MNRLQYETSPYLKQHAANPIEWYPWCSEALELARNEDRPIFLSIGYSTCHWCHVMAKECFEDLDVAVLMNIKFVNIKVDREERPDLDKIYQLAHALLSGRSGGWPLSIFLNPQTHVPFFAGTYFPRKSRPGLPGFVDVLDQVAQIYTENKEKFEKFEKEMLYTMDSVTRAKDAKEPEDLERWERQCRNALVSSFDKYAGGFGSAPKFPHSMSLDWLMEYWYSSRQANNLDREALDAAIHSLTAMARGGIYDHVGGGFFRYSTDRDWVIPHFEKMLYDNAMLLASYSHAFAITGDFLFGEAIQDTSAWLLHEMRSPEGAFFSAVDADSEGEEGKYYVWRRNEVKKLLNDEEHLVVETLYGLDKSANFEGRWHLRRMDAWNSVVRRLSMDPEKAYQIRQSARAKLLDARSQRIAPLTDRKILTAWNGLAVKGLVLASQALSEPELLQAAQQTADFLRENHFDGERLFAVSWERTPYIPGYLDDYVLVLEGLLALLSAQWRAVDIDFALTLADELVEQFYDADDGGFFFTAHDGDQLIHRPKPLSDESLPAGNATACLCLSRLVHLTGETRFVDVIEKTLGWAHGFLQDPGSGFPSFLRCIHKHRNPGRQVVIRGSRSSMQDWQAAVSSQYRPDTEVWAIPHDMTGFVPPYLAGTTSTDSSEEVRAYICEDFACSEPIGSLEEFRRILDS